MESYPITIGRITRHVPLIEPTPGVRIPLVELMGDVELVRAAAEALLPKIPPETQYLLTTETSPIVLAHELSGMLKLPYLVARRRRRPYMEAPLIQEVESLTLGVNEVLWLDSRLAEKLLGQAVTLVTDVVSTGGTLSALERIAIRAGARVVGRVAVFRQGHPKIEVATLGELPILQAA
jgi:adenine phosphoribosyltransferase